MSQLRESVLAAKERLAHGMTRLQARHQGGGSGVEVCDALCQLRDDVLMDLLQCILVDLKATNSAGLMSEVALVAHGGYGRRDVAPFSDVDLMILHAPEAKGPYAALAERMLRDVFDAGLTLGQTLCTPQQACQLAGDDAQVCTSLGESRLLAGSEPVFADFQKRLRKLAAGRRKSIVSAIDKARREERVRFGETVFLLEPNLKRSSGTLRDIQLLRWVGFARYGENDPRRLHELGVLSAEDLASLERAYEFLLRLRNELHFHQGKPGDVLDRSEQLRIAETLGYPPVSGMLPVEQFMRDYFRHTHQVSHVASQFVSKARHNERLQWWITSLFGHRAQDHLRVGPSGIMATRRGHQQLRGNMRAVMRLVDLANLYDKPVAPVTWDVVRQEAPHLPQTPDGESLRHFHSLLSHPAKLGHFLRELHEVGMLERFVPAFGHARGLLQFNQYHKYTVDEHCLRAVEAVSELAVGAGPMAQAYRRIGRKRVLHLALLIHDLGKGFPEDHVLVGQRIAAETAQRLDLPPLDAETLRTLVAEHQTMGTLAFRRDTSDPDLVLRFAIDVGSPELLAMLYVMTAADYTAVGPGVWDDWKAEILTELYFRAMEHLSGDATAGTREEQLEQQRQAVGVWLGPQFKEPWFDRHLRGLPAAYLGSTNARQVADDLRLLKDLPGDGVIAQGQFQSETRAVQFTVGTREDIVPGIFHRLTGALTSQGLEILSAQINTLADGLVIDRFWVTDPDFTGEPSADRIAQVCRALSDSLHAAAGQTPTFRRTWQIGRRDDALLRMLPTRVNIDNSSSDRYTVLDIFAHDRVGLLYAITRRLFELGLSVWRAKISTHLDQVVDVFYVTDAEGKKLENEKRLVDIRRQLIEVIEAKATA